MIASSAQAASQSAPSQPQGIPAELKAAGITEKLGARIPVGEVTLRDELGQSVLLKNYFSKGRPVILIFVYFECPSLCSFVLNALVDVLKEMPAEGKSWLPGQNFDVVTVSIDPKEGPELASKKKQAYLRSLGELGANPELGKGWHFLTGDENQIKKLASEAGFGYTYEEKEKQYAHSAGLFVLTPEGQISRILYGINYKTRDVRLAVTEAAQGKIGTVVDRFLLFCYRYDPNSRSYSVYLFNVMRVASAVTVLVMALAFGVVWLKQRRANSGAQAG